MHFFGKRRKSSAEPTDRPRHRFQAELTPLDARQLLSVTVVTAVATPKFLPDNGRFVPVTVSGNIKQVISTPLPGRVKGPPPASELAGINAYNATRPGPSALLGHITDQYRQVEPKVRVAVTQLLNSSNFYLPPNIFNPIAYEATVRNYSYSFTVDLQAKASTIGRQYDINVFSTDSQSGNQANIGVLVPPHGAGHPAHVVATHHVFVQPRTRPGVERLSAAK